MTYTSVSFSQDIPPDWEPSEDPSVRSIHVKPADIVGKPDWCSYAIDMKMPYFMEEEKLKKFRKIDLLVTEVSNVTGRTKTCLWMTACKRGWDHSDFFIGEILTSAEEIANSELDEENKEKEKRNKQADIENKPHKDTSQSPSVLGGARDTYVSFYIPYEIYVSTMKYNCNRYFDQNQLVKKINPNLTEKNQEQDDAYISANQYGDGVLHELHYRYAEMQQSHVLMKSYAKVLKNRWVYDFYKKEFVRKP